jgi:hypothetical protein
MFQQSPEEEAFKRWRNHQFLELERSQARAWRLGLSNINLDETHKEFQRLFPSGKPKTLSDAKKLVDLYIDGPDQETTFVFGMTILDVTPHTQASVIARWRASGKPPLRQFAPYFTHIFSVDLFFNIAIAADLIGRGRPSHKIDLAYVYYLPFCNVFTSNDKLHAEIVPFFLRPNQTFVLGSELKADLAMLDMHYDALPDDVKKRGVISFAYYPPADDSFLVARLWDKYMSPTWRENRVMPRPQPDNPAIKAFLEKMRRFKEEGVPVPDESLANSDDAHQMVIERKISARKGKWNRFPPEVVNRRKNEKGEWEDIPPAEWKS